MVATDGELLLRAILDNPAEDTPRLVYADWLDENGQGARAAFIRAQVAGGTAQPPRELGRAIMGDLRDWTYSPVLPAEGQAEPLHAWMTNLSRFCPLGVIWAVFRRGFVSQVICAAADWMSRADELAAAHPIERVRFTRLTGADITRLCGLMRERKPGEWAAMADGNWQNGVKLILRHLWPRVAFELLEGAPRFDQLDVLTTQARQELESARRIMRPVLSPDPGAGFLAGLDWRVEVREEPSVTHAPPVVTADMYAGTEGPVPRDLLGTSFGPVVAEGRRGQRWHVERAVIDWTRSDADTSGPFRVVLHAQSAGAVRPA